MSLLAAARVVLHDKTCFIASLCPSLYIETVQCCITVMYFLLILGCRLKKIHALIFLAELNCGLCLGMFCATACVLCVFVYLCLNICVSLDLSIRGSTPPLFGTMIATLCSLLKLLPCFCLHMATLPPLTMQLQTAANKYTYMLTIAEPSWLLLSYVYTNTWIYTSLSPI